MRSRDKQHVQPTPLLSQLEPSRTPSTSPPSAKSTPLSALGANRRKGKSNVHWYFAELGSEGKKGVVQEVQKEGRAGLVCSVVEVGRGVTAARARCHTTNLSTFAKQTPALSSPRTGDLKGRGATGMYVFCATSRRSPLGEGGGTKRVFEAQDAREGHESIESMDAKSTLTSLQVVAATTISFAASPSFVGASPVLADFAEGVQCPQVPPSPLCSLPPLPRGKMEVPCVAGEHGDDGEHGGRWQQDQLTGEMLWVYFSARDLSSQDTQGRGGEAGEGSGGGGGFRAGER